MKTPEEILSGLKVALVGAGLNPQTLEHFGSKITKEDGTEIEINSEVLSGQIIDTVLRKGLTEGRHKSYDLYNKEVEEMSRKRFNDAIKDIGERLLPDDAETAKKIAAKYKESGKFTAKELADYTEELMKLKVSPYEEKLKNTSLEGKQFQEILDAERRERTKLEQAKMEIEQQLERLNKEVLPEVEAKFKSQMEQNRWETSLFVEFYKVPSIYDSQINNGDETAMKAKEAHIKNWLIRSFMETYEAKPDGYGRMLFYEKGKNDPVWITKNGTRVQADMPDIIRMIAKDPVKGGKYFLASNANPNSGQGSEEDAARHKERDKMRQSFFKKR